MKPNTDPYCACRVGEFQDKPKHLMADIIRLRRIGYPPVTARLMVVIQGLRDIQHMLVEAGCRVPEGEADGVPEALAMRATHEAIQQASYMLSVYGLREAKQAKPRR